MLHAYKTIDAVVDESKNSLEGLAYLSTDDPRRHRLTLEVLSTTEEGLDLEVEIESEPASPYYSKSQPKMSLGFHLGSEKDFTKATILSSLLWLIGFLLSISFYPTRSGKAGAKRGFGLSTSILGLIFSLYVLGNVLQSSFSFPLVIFSVLPVLTVSFGIYLFYQGTQEWRDMLNSTPWDTTSNLKSSFHK